MKDSYFVKRTSLMDKFCIMDYETGDAVGMIGSVNSFWDSLEDKEMKRFSLP